MKDRLWELSGPSSFIKDIVQDLRAGINIVIHIPKFNFYKFNEYLKEELKEELHWYELNPQNHPNGPIDYLIKSFLSSSDNYSLSVQELIDKNDSMRFLWLNLENLSFQEQNNWLLFLSEYINICDQKDRFKRLVFIFNSNGNTFKEQISSPFLKEHYFYDYVSTIDFERIINDSLTQLNNDYLHFNIIKSIIFETSYPNFDFAYYLIDHFEEIDDFNPNLLEKYISERQICIEHKKLYNIKSSIKPKYLNTSNPLYINWLNNLVRFGNNMIEPSVLNYFLRGKESYYFIWQKIWLAQLKIVFPLLEQYRIRIIEHLRNSGKTKELLLPIDNEKNSDVYNLEIGDLFHLIVVLKKIRVNNILLKLITNLRDVRNDLAHCKVVKYSKIRKLSEVFNLFNYESPNS